MASPIPRAAVLLTDGMEEMEAIILIDVMRRGNMDVFSYAQSPHKFRNSQKPIIPENIIQASRNTWHLADFPWGPNYKHLLDSSDIICIPGGLEGAKNWNADSLLPGVLKEFQEQGRWIGAICAAPQILLTNGILEKGDKYTAFPGSTPEEDGYTGNFLEILHDKKIITSKGPGTAFEMALAILRELMGEEISLKVRKGLQLPE